jgi:hypothetical protein
MSGYEEITSMDFENGVVGAGFELGSIGHACLERQAENFHRS